MNIVVLVGRVFCLRSFIPESNQGHINGIAKMSTDRPPDTLMPNTQSRKKNHTTIQGGILEDLLDDLNYMSDLLSLPPYAGPRHNFEARMAQKDWEKMYKGEIEKRRALRNLKEKKWLDAKTHGNEVVIRISSNAVVTALKNRIHSTSQKIGEGMKCLLAYDFPVGSDKARKVWLKLIKNLGLEYEQQSLYSTEFDVGLELKALAKAIGVERWTRIYTATDL